MFFSKLHRLFLLTASIITLNSLALGMLPGDPGAHIIVKKRSAAAEADSDICPICLNPLADSPNLQLMLDMFHAQDQDFESLGPGLFLYKGEGNPCNLSAYLPGYELDSMAPTTITTPCGHAFHTCCLVKSCLQQIKTKLPVSCPMCRREIGILWEKSLRPHIKKNMLTLYREVMEHTGIESVDSYGNTKLIQAIERYAGIDEITQLLQEARRTLNDEKYEAFINHQNKTGDTALHVALCTYSPLLEPETIEAIITLLRENGANPHLRNKKGQSAEDIYKFLHPTFCIIQ